jgi:hypothetical protein
MFGKQALEIFGVLPNGFLGLLADCDVAGVLGSFEFGDWFVRL